MNMLFYLFFDKMYTHNDPFVSLDETTRMFAVLEAYVEFSELYIDELLGCMNRTLKHKIIFINESLWASVKQGRSNMGEIYFRYIF